MATKTRIATALEEEVLTLRGRARAQAAELADNENLREQMAATLSESALALHGGARKNGLWSWHDLPELARAQRQKLREAADYLRTLDCESPYGRQLGAEIDALLDARKEETCKTTNSRQFKNRAL
jgi:hypothetical protein